MLNVLRIFQLKFFKDNLSVHKIIVAHGADEACKKWSNENIYGSLAICYGMSDQINAPLPFLVHLDKNNPIHILDSHNLEIVLGELDTISDFKEYLSEKEKTIKMLDFLIYPGEEDLLAHYMTNFDERTEKHFIWNNSLKANGVSISEGTWKEFVQSKIYKRKKQNDIRSYLWDEIIQNACEHALDGTLSGNADVFSNQTAFHQMTKEPRVSRRAVSKKILEAINQLPEPEEFARKVTVIKLNNVSYVFLQVSKKNIAHYGAYQTRRRRMLAIACGAFKNKCPSQKKIIGIAVEPLKYHKKEKVSWDFMLLNCETWSKEQKNYYERQNETLQFFRNDRVQEGRISEYEYPAARISKKAKIGRNEKCPCGSGKKYKKCCRY